MGLIHQRAWVKVQVGTRVLGPQPAHSGCTAGTHPLGTARTGRRKPASGGRHPRVPGWLQALQHPAPSPGCGQLLAGPLMGLGPGPGRYCNQSHCQEKTPGRARAPDLVKAFRPEGAPGTELLGGLMCLLTRCPQRGNSRTSTVPKGQLTASLPQR